MSERTHYLCPKTSMFTSVGYVEKQVVTKDRKVMARTGCSELCFHIIWFELALARDTTQRAVRMVRLFKARTI